MDKTEFIKDLDKKIKQYKKKGFLSACNIQRVYKLIKNMYKNEISIGFDQYNNRLSFWQKDTGNIYGKTWIYSIEKLLKNS